MDLKSSIKCGGIPSPIEVYEMGHTPMTERMDFFTGWLMGWFYDWVYHIITQQQKKGYTYPLAQWH